MFKMVLSYTRKAFRVFMLGREDTKRKIQLHGNRSNEPCCTLNYFLLKEKKD